MTTTDPQLDPVQKVLSALGEVPRSQAAELLEWAVRDLDIWAGMGIPRQNMPEAQWKCYRPARPAAVAALAEAGDNVTTAYDILRRAMQHNQNFMGGR